MIEIFTLLISMLVFYNIINERKINLNILVFIILIFIIFDGLRWETGTDWESYKYSFDNALDLKFNFEIGYTIYIYLFRMITDNYSIYLLTTSFLFYSIIFYKIFKFSNKSYFSIFFLIGTLPWYSGAIRQMISLIFFLFAIEYCIKRNYIKFLIFIFFGITFHTLMFLNIFIYFIYDISFFAYAILFFIILLVLFGFRTYLVQLQQILDIIRPDKSYDTYLSGGSSASGFNNFILGISRKIYTYLILIFFNKNYKKSNALFNFFFYMSLFSILSYIIGIYLIAGFSSRADIYYGLISTSILIGLIENKIKSKFHKFLYFIFIFSLLLINYYRLEYLDLFHPYKSIFYNTNFSRDLY